MENHGLSNKELERVLKFQGYGNKNGPYWFGGMEEGGGSVGELQKRAEKFGPVEFLHSSLDKIGLDTMYLHVPTWRIMSKLIMAMQRKPGWEETKSARDYQANKLGRGDGDTFLTELMPLPSRSTGVWPYPSIYPTRAEYYEAIRPGRIKWLSSEISSARPSFVICYGKGNWHHYEKIFPNIKFKSELDENIRVGQGEHGTILLLPFFSYYLVTKSLIKQIANLFGRRHNEG